MFSLFPELGCMLCGFFCSLLFCLHQTLLQCHSGLQVRLCTLQLFILLIPQSLYCLAHGLNPRVHITECILNTSECFPCFLCEFCNFSCSRGCCILQYTLRIPGQFLYIFHCHCSLCWHGSTSPHMQSLPNFFFCRHINLLLCMQPCTLHWWDEPTRNRFCTSNRGLINPKQVLITIHAFLYSSPKESPNNPQNNPPAKNPHSKLQRTTMMSHWRHNPCCLVACCAGDPLSPVVTFRL